MGHLLALEPVLGPLARRFGDAGHELAIVGGSVRDMLLDRVEVDPVHPERDIDLTTSARPAQTEAVLSEWADATWDVGQAFGTIGARKDSLVLEVTTYRADRYHPTSRKPEVVFGESLHGDLHRRDFSVNAMAITMPDAVFVDPFDGLRDLAAGLLRPPAPAQESFSDDPLRMLRAARFVSQLGFDVDPAAVQAMVSMASRLEIVSAERVRDELSRLLMGRHPRAAIDLLVESGLAAVVLPELPALRLEIDEHHRHKDVYQHSLTVLEQAIALEGRVGTGGPDLVTRLAALLHDVGKPRTRRFADGGRVTFHHHEVVGARMVRKRLSELRFPTKVVDDVATLVELHLRFHGYGSGEWTDSAVRRYVRDAGPLLSRLHVLTRADSTTRNVRKAAALQRSYDGLELRIAELQGREELAALRPALDGNAIMAILGIGPGPEVGRAYRYLMELRLEAGPMEPGAAEQALRAWWAAQARSADDARGQ